MLYLARSYPLYLVCISLERLFAARSSPITGIHYTSSAVSLVATHIFTLRSTLEDGEPKANKIR
jgi:hypothetical protein